MNPAAMLKVVDIIAVASITNTSVSPETLKDSLPSSNEVRNSITPTMGRGNVEDGEKTRREEQTKDYFDHPFHQDGTSGSRPK